MNQLRGTPLKRFLRDFRRAHPVTYNLVLVLQSVMYPVNVGSLFRIADATGVQHMYLCGITPTPPNKTIEKVGRSKDHKVNWSYVETAEDVIVGLREDGYHVAALEITDAAVPYYEAAYPRRLAVVVGNEDHGVTRSALELVDSSVFIPMYGKGQSLNVHVSVAVLLYHVLQHQRDVDPTDL
jgi:tRNA G18 (ribose-2'-O)-methylase SpoU